jgi:hypothetical protein
MNLLELKKDTKYLALGDENSTDYADAPLLRNINNWYDTVDNWIWRADSTWEFDDSGATTFPIATSDLVDGQDDYEIPSTARSIKLVEVKDASGNWQRLKKLDISQISGSPEELFKTPGMPLYYDVMGRSIILYPAPASDSVTLSGGLRMYVSRHITPLSVDTDEPGFDRSFHRILSIGAAMDYCVANTLSAKEVDLRRMIFGGDTTPGLKRELEEFYGKRHEEFKSRILRKKENYA